MKGNYSKGEPLFNQGQVEDVNTNNLSIIKADLMEVMRKLFRLFSRMKKQHFHKQFSLLSNYFPPLFYHMYL